MLHANVINPSFRLQLLQRLTQLALRTRQQHQGRGNGRQVDRVQFATEMLILHVQLQLPRLPALMLISHLEPLGAQLPTLGQFFPLQQTTSGRHAVGLTIALPGQRVLTQLQLGQLPGSCLAFQPETKIQFSLQSRLYIRRIRTRRAL